MIEFRAVTDPKAWDDFAQKHPLATFLDSWTWGEFERSYGVNYENIGLYKENELVGILPIMGVKAKRGRYLHLRHAPIIDWSDSALVKQVVDYLKAKAKTEGYHFIRVSPLLPRTAENTAILTAQGFKRAPVPAMDAIETLKIEISKPEEEILAQMRKNTRYYIKKAEKMGVSVRRVTDFDKDFDTFWEIFMDGVKRNKWVPFTKKSVYSELKTFEKANMVAMYISEYEGVAISAAMFTFFNNRSYYHHSGSLTKYRNIPSTYRLIWEAMLDAKERGFTEIDLWGVSPEDEPNHPWAGLSLFKRGFGGKEYLMVEAHDLVVSPLGHITRLYEKLEGRLRGH